MKTNIGQRELLTEDSTVLGFNNIEMTVDEAKFAIDWIAEQRQMVEQSGEDPQTLEMLENFGALIEIALNLGHAHTEDTKEAVNIIIASDYVVQEVDPAEDAEELDPTTQAETETLADKTDESAANAAK